MTRHDRPVMHITHHHPGDRPWGRALPTAPTAIVAALLSAILCLLPSGRAWAVAFDRDPAEAPTVTAPTNSASSDAPSGVRLTIGSSTSVVTSSSGYRTTVTISNGTDTPLKPGDLTVSTNAYYSFVSRTDIQQWAQSGVRIPVPDVLGHADVSTIAPGASTSVTVSVPADQNRLTAIASWGPKPVLLRYTSDGTTVDEHTFLTRSPDGLATADTPAMTITMALPLGTDTWQANDSALNALLAARDDGTANGSATRGDTAKGSAAGASKSTGATDGAPADTDGDATDTPDAEGDTPTTAATTGSTNAVIPDTASDGGKAERARASTLSRHPLLQAIADPSYLGAMSAPPHVSGITQPGMVDIAAYATLGDEQAYAKAAVEPARWNAAAGRQWLRGTVSDAQDSTPAYAWGPDNAWTQQTLAQAKTHGYDTVIADSTDASREDAATVHTGKTVVPTQAGDVTVLSCQSMLSSLAQGRRSDERALGEDSAAGRLARFMAQSAFYQMEQPYTPRHLLACFGTSSSSADVDALMTAVEQAPWLSLSDMDALSDADAYLTGEPAAQAIDGTGPDEATMDATRATLSALAAGRSDIARFRDEILDRDAPTADGSAPSNKGDEQSLARQDASATARRSRNSEAWIDSIANAYADMALHALSADASVRERMLSSAQSLAQRLLSGVTVTVPNAITVVSESASMPVTVSNGYPYPVRVRVSSLTDSMEIVTSRLSDIDVPAMGEAQAIFTIRVSTSGSASARISLQDRAGKTFSTAQSTTITSTLQISDKTGFGIIGAAIILGALGLWRQFHRKKDPDE